MTLASHCNWGSLGALIQNLGAKHTSPKGSAWELKARKAVTAHRVRSTGGARLRPFPIVLRDRSRLIQPPGASRQRPSGGGREGLAQTACRCRPQGRQPPAQQVGGLPPRGRRPYTGLPLRRRARSLRNASGSGRSSQPSRRRSPPPQPAESPGLGPSAPDAPQAQQGPGT